MGQWKDGMIQDNATQTGAEGLQPAHTGRNAALAQIAKTVNDSYSEDMSAFNEATGEILPKEQPAVEAQAPEVEQQQGQSDENQTQQSGEPPEEDVQTILVQGQSVQVKKSQVWDAGVRTLQKEATADKRLQEATEMLRQAQAYTANLRQQHQPSQDTGATQPLPEQDAANRSGNPSQTQATPDIRALVKHELWLTNAETAAQRFRKDFKDIADDPMLMRLAAQLEDERLATAANTGESLGDPWEAYKKHGETLRARFGKPQTTATPAVSEDRLERKRSTTTVVGSGARMQPTSTPKPLTPSEIIEQQRLARQRGRQIQPSR